MQIQQILRRMVDDSETTAKIKGAYGLMPFVHDSRVLDVLCEAAVTTTRHRFRCALIDILKGNAAGACKRFSDDVLWSKNPTARKWALVNLSLMGCKDAKNAVISGLYDPDATVREAAALNVGLYADETVQAVFDRYFEAQPGHAAVPLGRSAACSMAESTTSLDDDDAAMTVANL